MKKKVGEKLKRSKMKSFEKSEFGRPFLSSYEQTYKNFLVLKLLKFQLLFSK